MFKNQQFWYYSVDQIEFPRTPPNLTGNNKVLIFGVEKIWMIANLSKLHNRIRKLSNATVGRVNSKSSLIIDLTIQEFLPV